MVAASQVSAWQLAETEGARATLRSMVEGMSASVA